MSRLTYKDTKVSGGYNAVDTDEYACVVKLGKLEDLEEQLGCPLEVVVEAINQDFIFVEQYERDEKNDLIVPYRIVLIKFEDVHFGKTKNYAINHYCLSFPTDLWVGCVELENYKKTWWLKEDRSE